MTGPGFVMSVVGARPQVIKLAVVAAALEEAGYRHTTLHTGQHYDYGISEVFFDELGIADPAHNLAVGSGGHGEQTGRALQLIEPILIRDTPDWVIVYGDTNSTLAGALAASKLRIPVAHVEAGMRYRIDTHIPEEINRVVTDHVSDLLLAPTKEAVTNLAREGMGPDRVRLIGDVTYDAALRFGKKSDESSDILARLSLSQGEYILVTLHRAENTDVTWRLRALAYCLMALADETPVVLPLHPRTRHALLREGRMESLARAVTILEPIGYLDMLRLERSAALIATDSGGVQKEAYFARVPCVTLLEETEWVELVDLGWNTLVPPSEVSEMVPRILERIGKVGTEASLYGGGQAAQRVPAELMTFDTGPIVGGPYSGSSA